MSWKKATPAVNVACRDAAAPENTALSALKVLGIILDHLARLVGWPPVQEAAA
jgi:hypothetical protein